MKLELNIKEWVALLGLLERQVPNPDKHLVEVHNRMKATLVSVLTSAERLQAEQWLELTQRKIDDLAKQNRDVVSDTTSLVQGNVLTDDENEFHSTSQYPKGQPRRRSNHKK